ncbi:MAG: N-acetyltransferase family protein [Rhodothermales bacterium]
MSDLQFRDAVLEDLPFLVQTLADDPLGAQREQFETPLPAAYTEAFQTIHSDPNHRLILCEVDGIIAGFFQLSFLPNLTYIGSWRALIEGVRVAKTHRRQGIGRAMFEHAIALCKARKCILLQLTTDKKRPEAVAFYESLGFIASHEGMKLGL